MAKPESKRRRKIMSINDGLPPHIIQLILSKLPVLNLPACRIVSKAWNDLILDYASTSKLLPNNFLLCTRKTSNSRLSFGEHTIRCVGFDCVGFDAKHVKEMNFSTLCWEDRRWSSKFSVINSCNGLLFVFKSVIDTACSVGILNPMTNEFIGLPPTAIPCHVFDYGLGFSHKTKCYKVARVSRINFSSSKFEIFTFGGSNQWSYVHSLPFVRIRTNGVYFNGNLYWIGIDQQKNTPEYAICRLDVENEKIEETMSLMEVVILRSVPSISVLNNDLCATFSYLHSYKIEVWMMRKFRGKESWSRKFVINDIPNAWAFQPPLSKIYFQMIKVYEDGEILCLINNDSFFSYNPKTARIKTLNQIEPTKINTFNRIHPDLRVFLWSCKIEYLNFSSLQAILGLRDDA